MDMAKAKELFDVASQLAVERDKLRDNFTQVETYLKAASCGVSGWVDIPEGCSLGYGKHNGTWGLLIKRKTGPTQTVPFETVHIHAASVEQRLHASAHLDTLLVHLAARVHETLRLTREAAATAKLIADAIASCLPDTVEAKSVPESATKEPRVLMAPNGRAIGTLHAKQHDEVPGCTLLRCVPKVNSVTRPNPGEISSTPVFNKI